MKTQFNPDYDSSKLLTMLSERGVDYGDNAVAGVFRDKLFVREGKSKTVDVFVLPLSMVAEVVDEYPVDQTPFSAKFKPDIYIPNTCTEATQIITNQSVFNRLMLMDQEFVGKADYMGLAYFWNHEYRHTLRDCNVQSRVAVHAAWRANGLALDGVSKQHEKIMQAALKKVAGELKEKSV